MFLNKIVLTVAAAASLSLTTLAVTPKTDLKANTEVNASPAETKTNSGLNYYWFDVTPDGTALASTTGISASEPATPTGECQGSQPEYCQRGYTASQTIISSGRRLVNVAVDASPMEDHKE
jgi:hypothetical protein